MIEIAINCLSQDSCENEMKSWLHVACSAKYHKKIVNTSYDDGSDSDIDYY